MAAAMAADKDGDGKLSEEELLAFVSHRFRSLVVVPHHLHPRRPVCSDAAVGFTGGQGWRWRGDARRARGGCRGHAARKKAAKNAKAAVATSVPLCGQPGSVPRTHACTST